MRREPTPAERVMCGLLRSRQFAGLKFRRQVPIGDYIVDFTHLYPRVVIACDGGQHADSGYDVRRDAWLRGQGPLVINFWNHEVIYEADGVLEALRLALVRL